MNLPIAFSLACSFVGVFITALGAIPYSRADEYDRAAPHYLPRQIMQAGAVLVFAGFAIAAALWVAKQAGAQI